MASMLATDSIINTRSRNEVTKPIANVRFTTCGNLSSGSTIFSTICIAASVLVNAYIELLISSSHTVLTSHLVVPQVLKTNTSGCACFLRNMVRQKMTQKPMTESIRLACRIWEITQGLMNNGQAAKFLICGILLTK